MAIYLKLDEPTLREVARMTGGEYHHAGTAEALRSVYQKLGTRPQTQTRDTELTALLALLAAILIVVRASLSVLWFGRVTCALAALRARYGRPGESQSEVLPLDPCCPSTLGLG